MKHFLKETVKGGLRLLLTPFRWATTPDRRAVGTSVPKVTFPNAAMLKQVGVFVREGHTVTIHVKGYSMRPFLEHCRDQVVLGCFDRLQVGDVVLAEIRPGVYVLHRIIKKEQDRLTLMGDGNLKGVEYCTEDRVCAVVHTFIRNGRRIPADDPQWNRYARWWRFLLPVRRVLLLFYKANLS